MVQTDGIDFGMYSQKLFERYMTRLSELKISWRGGKQYTSPSTLGGGGEALKNTACGPNKVPQKKKIYIYIAIYIYIKKNK